MRLWPCCGRSSCGRLWVCCCGFWSGVCDGLRFGCGCWGFCVFGFCVGIVRSRGAPVIGACTAQQPLCQSRKPPCHADLCVIAPDIACNAFRRLQIFLHGSQRSRPQARRVSAASAPCMHSDSGRPGGAPPPAHGCSTRRGMDRVSVSLSFVIVSPSRMRCTTATTDRGGSAAAVCAATAASIARPSASTPERRPLTVCPPRNPRAMWRASRSAAHLRGCSCSRSRTRTG